MPEPNQLTMAEIQQMLGEYVVALHLARKQIGQLEQELHDLRSLKLVKEPSSGENVVGR